MILGSFPNLMESSKEKAKEKDCVLSYKTRYIMRQTDSLVSFFEHICTRPETPPLYQNKIVDEIRELVIKDYFMVMRLVMVRLQVLRERLIIPGFESGLNDMSSVLMRLEECKASLSEFFWCCRRLTEDFWCLVDILKAETVNDEKAMVEFVGSVQTTLKDDEEMDELAGSVQTEWVTFDDSKTTTDVVIRWDSEWVTFNDSKELTIQPMYT